MCAVKMEIHDCMQVTDGGYNPRLQMSSAPVINAVSNSFSPLLTSVSPLLEEDNGKKEMKEKWDESQAALSCLALK